MFGMRLAMALMVGLAFVFQSDTLPPGSLDPNFGPEGDGVARISITESQASSLLLLPDGSLLVSGSGARDALLIKLDANATRASIEDDSNYLWIDFGDAPAGLSGLKLLPDGKISAVGSVRLSGEPTTFVIRLLEDGLTLDESFGTDGFVFLEGLDERSGGGDVTWQPDGKLLYAYSVPEGEGQKPVLRRYLANGEPDLDFGTDGRVEVSFAPATARPYAVALQSDGKILLAGWYRLDWLNDDTFVIRLNPEGSLDPSFAEDGQWVGDLTRGGDENSWCLAVQPDGRILIAGQLYLSGPEDWTARYFLTRLLPGGTIDPSFGENGLVLRNGIGHHDSIHRILIQSNGRVIAAGTSLRDNISGPSDYVIELMRFLPDGSDDTSFGDQGKVIFESNPNEADFMDRVFNITLQPDGKLLMSGQTYAPNIAPNISGMVIARFIGDPPLDQRVYLPALTR